MSLFSFQPRKTPEGRYAIAPEILLKAEAMEGEALGVTEPSSLMDENKDDEISSCYSYSKLQDDIKVYAEVGTHYCLNDQQPFHRIPLPLPLSYNAKTKIFGIMGKFCSPGCLKRYILHRRGLPLPLNKLLSLMTTMMVVVYNIKEEIIAAPPLELLSIHCSGGKGGYSLAEYRSKGTSGFHVDFVFPPFCYTPVTVCVQKVVSIDEITEKISRAGIKDKLHRRTTKKQQSHQQQEEQKEQQEPSHKHKSAPSLLALFSSSIRENNNSTIAPPPI